MYLTKANLDILEHKRVKILQKVDLDTPMDLKDDSSSYIRLEPGESFQCVYKIRASPCDQDATESTVKHV